MIHPWDINEVHKGWQLTPSELEGVTGHKRETNAYRLAVVALAQRLDRELSDDDRPCTIAEVKGCLRVLTDKEATEYNERRQRQCERVTFRTHNKQMHVDVSGFTQEETAKHDSRLIHSGLRVAALRSARSQFRKRVLAGSKNTPSLPGVGGESV